MEFETTNLSDEEVKAKSDELHVKLCHLLEQYDASMIGAAVVCTRNRDENGDISSSSIAFNHMNCVSQGQIIHVLGSLAKAAKALMKDTELDKKYGDFTEEMGDDD